MSQVNRQIPIDTSLRDQASKVAKSLGFSSLQDSIRLFLHQLASQSLEVTFQPKTIKVSAKNEKRYLGMIKDFKKNRSKYRSFDNVDDMMKYLNSDQDNSCP